MFDRQRQVMTSCLLHFTLLAIYVQSAHYEILLVNSASIDCESTVTE